jgi:starch synthase
MMRTVRYAVSLYKKQRGAFDQIVKNAMAGDFSWGPSAQRYMEIYQKTAEK